MTNLHCGRYKTGMIILAHKREVLLTSDFIFHSTQSSDAKTQKVEERPGVGRVLLASADIAPWQQVKRIVKTDNFKVKNL